jgi:hypothetical protein
MQQDQGDSEHRDDPDESFLMSPTLPWVQKERGQIATPPLTISIARADRATGHTARRAASGPSHTNGATLHPNDERRPSHESSGTQIGTGSSLGSSIGMDSAASVVSSNSKAQSDTSRKSSIFRLGRRSFGRKKSGQEKIVSPAPELATSLESRRSRGSVGSLTGWSGKSSTSQSSSPVIYRDAPSLPAPVRASMSSLRTGGSASTSDVEGNRASSDLDSLGGNGRMTWGRNRSSISLMGDSIAEGSETLYRPPLSGGRLSVASSSAMEQDEGGPSTSISKKPPMLSRFQAQRSFSSSSVPQWNEKRAADRYSSSLSSPNSPGSIRQVSGRAPTSKNISEFADTKKHYDTQRVSRSSKRAEDGPNEKRPDSATLTPFKVKKRANVSSMIDEGANGSSRRANQLDLYQFLGSNEVEKEQRPAQQNSLEVPSTGGAARGVLRKTRSQSSFILSRRPSFLGGKQKDTDKQAEDEQVRVASLPQTRKARNSTSQSPKTTRPFTSGGIESGSASPNRMSPITSRTKKSPWDRMFSSRMEIADSSPDLETKGGFFALSKRNRGSSVSSMDKLFAAPSQGSKASRSRNGSASASTSRPVSPLVNSRLDSSGGAANLFGTASSKPRQRASSILPSMPWRPRNGSNADRVPSSSTSDIQSSSESKSSSEKDKVPSSVKVDTSQFDGNAHEFVKYVLAKVPRSDYSAVLASSGDELHRQALHIYMQQFYFAGNPLDIALRKLLMSVCLPKETQQIDRVMEAFARRYNECNETLFTSDDQPYVLAFSLMMLHTDAFNKNAKQKMTKQDYLRNTASSGVRDEILEYLYDNLTFTQFIYVEDDEAISKRKADYEPLNSGSFLSAFSSGGNSSSKNRIDPYYIIASGQTHTLRADISTIIAEDSPFSAKGTAATYDIEALNRSFVNAPSIEIVTTRRPSLSAANGLGSDTLSTSLGAVEKQQETVVTLRVTKVGCISRKDDIVDDNKKAQSRRWKTCGMVLSSSQLLFFKDLVWTSALDQQIREQTSQSPDQEGGVLITPRITYFRPDGVLALGDAIAMRDTSYRKSDYVIRLIARQGDQSRQYLIQTANESEMNDWIHKINFCAAFRASGLRIRGLDLPGTPSLDSQGTNGFSQSSLDFGVEGEPTAFSPPLSPGLSATSEGSFSSNGVPLVGLMRRKLNARRKEVMPKLALTTLKYQESQAELEEALRFARHLGILTPFMKITRDRIETTAISLSHRIRQLRIDTAKYGSRREILHIELEAGDRAARATASPSSFDDYDVQQESRPSANISSLPSSMIEISNSNFLNGRYQRDAEMDEGNLATPKVHTMKMDEDHAALSPAVILRQNSSPPLQSSSQYLLSDEPSLDDVLAQTLDAPLFLDYQVQTSSTNNTPTSAASSAASIPETTKTPPPTHSSRRFKHSSTAPREEAERWDRSKVVKNSKRVSLVTLPDAEHLKDLARLSINHVVMGNGNSNILEERIS